MDGDFERALRRALHVAADSIEPSEDGLTRICQRLTTPWLVRRASLLVTDWEYLARLITIWLEPAFTSAMSYLTTVSSAAYGTRRRLMPRLRPAMAWLRPAMAVTGIAIIAAVGILALRQAAATISLQTRTGTSTAALPGPHSANAGHRQSPPPNATGTSPAQITHTQPGNTPARAGRAAHQPSCAPARCPRRLAGTPAPIPSPAITPSGLLTPSPSQSPAPTPAPTHRHHRPHPHPTRSHHPGHKGL
jgi:hypothetical protein